MSPACSVLTALYLKIVLSVASGRNWSGPLTCDTVTQLQHHVGTFVHALYFLSLLQLDACALAQKTQSEVQHSLLDKVKRCSAHPDQAASFFCRILHPVPHMRVTNLEHPWFRDTVTRMVDEMKVDYEAAEAKRRSEAKSGWCAALCGCWCGSSSTIEAESCVTTDPSPAKDKGGNSKGSKKHQPSQPRCSKRTRSPAILSVTTDHFAPSIAEADSMQTVCSQLMWSEVCGEAQEGSHRHVKA